MGLYFFTYNLVNLVCWSYMLFTVVDHLSNKFYFSLAFQTMDVLRIIQSIAILEPLHALILNTSVLNTLMQVASRLLIVWGPHYVWQTEDIRMHFSYSVLVSAWSVAEIIRYAFYCFKELDYIPYPLTWVRYTGFIVLYPIGVSMEVITIYLVTLQKHWFNPILYAIMASYVPGLFVLYTYMLRQRNKALGVKSKIEKDSVRKSEKKTE